MTRPLRISSRVGADRLELSLEGEFDHASADALRAALEENTGLDVLLDLSDVTFMDSGGLNALVGAHRRATYDGHAIAVASCPPPIMRVFELTGLDDMFPITSSAGPPAGVRS